MNRVVLLAWLVIGCLSAGFVFYVANDVAHLEEELRRVERQILKEQRAIHVMAAEWSYINRPDRLADLARRHLDLAPLPADRIVRIDDLPARPLVTLSLDSGDESEDRAP
jgi:hypothetical protein